MEYIFCFSILSHFFLNYYVTIHFFYESQYFIIKQSLKKKKNKIIQSKVNCHQVDDILQFVFNRVRFVG